MMDRLIEGAAALGLALDTGQVARFQAYQDLLLDWNTRVNLTAITDPAGVQTRHFVDSLAVAAALLAWDRPLPPTPSPTKGGGDDRPHPPAPSPTKGGGDDRPLPPTPSPTKGGGVQIPAIFSAEQNPLVIQNSALRTPNSSHSAIRNPHSALLDLGTGAGLPGLPLAILWPDLPLTLVDSIGKKTAFVQAVVDALELRAVRVLTARAETLGLDRGHRAAYSVATARAVAALPVLAEYGLPLCRVGGILCAPKKGDLAAEIAAATRAAAQLGGGPLLVFRYRLPDETEERLIIGMPKVAPTPPGYPRRVGLARSRPLG
ncbi:MAG: 16S rRNA (guanine(527)-N(7))-methyltransferase RsmG [Chloroflexota bacterium]|nr:16S rRNA (guanine(527)-N(7))-methyltransferase RsmG [Chloroflexota bacterium]